MVHQVKKKIFLTLIRATFPLLYIIGEILTGVVCNSWGDMFLYNVKSSGKRKVVWTGIFHYSSASKKQTCKITNNSTKFLFMALVARTISQYIFNRPGVAGAVVQTAS